MLVCSIPAQLLMPLYLPFQVPVDADDAEIEERILQHLAAAAAIRRSHRHARREDRRSRSAAHGHGHPQILFFPTAAEATPGGSLSSHPPQEGDHEHASAVISSRPLPTVDSAEETAEDTSVNHTASVNGPVGSHDRYFLHNSTVYIYL